MSKALDDIKIEIAAMRRGSQNKKSKPHKILMLLAVLDLADAGLLTENKIPFDTALIDRFQKNFRTYATAQDWLQPGPPFFHLRSSTFWSHKPKQGREAQYAALDTSGGGTKRILENIEYAYLTNELFQVVSDPKQREELKMFLVSLLDD